ncbi:MAG TPA: hypothetical protein VFW34_11095 [Candidatus Rubrimentiphilum sp.]|nr:hypothetical protein [Candidatus Rubrimentiphilum sp.]
MRDRGSRDVRYGLPAMRTIGGEFLPDGRSKAQIPGSRRNDDHGITREIGLRNIAQVDQRAGDARRAAGALRIHRDLRDSKKIIFDQARRVVGTCRIRDSGIRFDVQLREQRSDCANTLAKRFGRPPSPLTGQLHRKRGVPRVKRVSPRRFPTRWIHRVLHREVHDAAHSLLQHRVQRQRRVGWIRRTRPRFVRTLQPSGLELTDHHGKMRLRSDEPGRKLQLRAIVFTDAVRVALIPVSPRPDRRRCGDFHLIGVDE